MNRIPLFLSIRYLIGSKQERSISAMIIVCFLGITIGSFALVASVMNGFEHVTHEKMQGIHSQIIMHADGELLNTKKIGTVLQKEFPAIAAYSPNGSEQAIIQNPETKEIHDVVMIKGIAPKTEPCISCLEKKILAPSKKTLADLLIKNNVLIGKKLAENLELQIGEPLTLFISSDKNIRSKKVRFDDEHVVVSGIFAIGIDEFDSRCIFCSLNLLTKLFPESGPTELGIQLQPGSNEQSIINALEKRLGLTVYSWKELYPALVSALKLEKYVMFLILALITLVASMNIISLMFMQIARKRSDIAILKAMGMPENALVKTFLFLGMSIAFIGSAVGLFLAFIAGFILETYPFITLPDAYYISHLPCKMTGSIFLIVFVIVIVLSFISTWFTARHTKQINISHVLRFEG